MEIPYRGLLVAIGNKPLRNKIAAGITKWKLQQVADIQYNPTLHLAFILLEVSAKNNIFSVEKKVVSSPTILAEKSVPGVIRQQPEQRAENSSQFQETLLCLTYAFNNRLGYFTRAALLL